MEISEDSHRKQSKPGFGALAYHVVMLAAFIIGLYGLVSLFSLASAEIQHSGHIVGSLQ